jgi:Diaminopimelate epimerase
LDFKAFRLGGLGCDFVIIVLRAAAYDLHYSPIKKICDRGPIGCVQLILIYGSDGFDAFLTFWHSDGSDSAACGDGTRCVASLLS